VTGRASRLALGLATLLAVASIATGCQQALVCDVSLFAVRTGQIAPGDALPPDSKLILDAGDFDPTQATIGRTDQGTEVELDVQPGAAERLRTFTAENTGSFMAITLNGSVVSVALIQGEITGGGLALTLPPTAQEEIDAFSTCIPRRALPEP
jgi:hypothetical protein